MKVCLINPASDIGTGFWPPLSLAYIGATLRADGHDVVVLDRVILQAGCREWSKVDSDSISFLRQAAPDVVGITATTPLIPDAFRSAELVRKLLPSCRIVLGGVHCTILPEETLRACSSIDIVAIGEGEPIMSDICRIEDPSKIPGIYYRQNGAILNTGPREPIADIDALPMPDRSLLNMRRYLKGGEGQEGISLIRGIEATGTHLLTSRGCPFKCSFCAGSVAFGKKVRYHSVNRVLEEVEHLISAYHVEALYFAEDMFTAHKQRAVEICEQMIRRKINRKVIWAAQARVNGLDLDFLKLMRTAGCVQVEFGFESGSQKMLDLMKKRVSVDDNYSAATLAHKAGLRFLANIIVGMPGETEQDFMETVRLIETTKPPAIGFNKLIPFPGSDLYDMLKSEKRIETDWVKYFTGYKGAEGYDFTAMPQGRFVQLFDHYRLKLVKPLLDRGYISYNLPRKPFRVIRTLIRFVASKPHLARIRITRFLSLIVKKLLGTR